jgi:hypothetical protein
MMRSGVHPFRMGFGRPNAILPCRRRRELFGLVLLVLCASPALSQTVTGHASVDFGASTLGRTVILKVLTLTPGVDTVIDSYTFTGANTSDFTVTTDSCPVGSTITAGTSCDVKVSFAPTAGTCRNALLRVASHDVATNQNFLDVVGLIGAGIGPDLPGTVPLELPFSARVQGTPTITPVAGSVESTVAVTPTVLATRGGLSQLTVQGTLIPATAGSPLTSVGINAQHFVGTLFAVTGLDTLDLCSVATAVPAPVGQPTIQEIFYVAGGTGRFAGATGSGTIVTTADAAGVLTSVYTGTLTLRIPTGPFAFIYLTDLLHSY